MQNRMKNHPLTSQQIDALLDKASVGSLAMTDLQGAPYGIPVHYIYDGGNIYFHGLPKGEKIDNLEKNPRVCFTVYQMVGLIIDENEVVCDTNTEYNSVIIRGDAEILTDLEEKERLLGLVVDKYTPQFTGRKLPDNMISGTAVVKITPLKTTGKYYK